MYSYTLNFHVPGKHSTLTTNVELIEKITLQHTVSMSQIHINLPTIWRIAWSWRIYSANTIRCKHTTATNYL